MKIKLKKIMKPNFKPAKLTTRVMKTRLHHKKQIEKNRKAYL
jgi:hypothetical protein